MKLEVSPKNDCKGVYCRFTVNAYLSQHNSIEIKKSLRKLKKLSCKGCEACCWYEEELREWVINEPNFDYLSNLKHWKIYRVIPQFEAESCNSYTFNQLFEFSGFTFEEVPE